MQNTQVLKLTLIKTQVVWIGRNKYSTETIKTKWKLTWGITHFKLLGIHFDIDLDKVININYNDKISKIETLIKIWNRRYLTPIGKITVVKTLLIPILNHLFMSLPNPPPCTIKSINNLFYSFIWQGPSKIKNSQSWFRNIVEEDLKMININVFIAALKVTWIRLILNDGKWANITQISLKELSDFGDAYILNKMKTILNPFWADVLSSLHKLMKIKNTQIDIDNALQTPIFFNENILVGRKPVFISTWYNKEVTLVNDLVKDNGDFYTESEFKNIFHVKTNFIQYQGIVNAIKSFANKNNITFNTKCISPIQPSIFSCITKSKRGCQDIYKILNNNKDEPTSKLKWQQIYTIDEQTWDKIFNSPFSNKLSSQQQWLQTRINHRILPCKKYLHTLKLIENSSCSSCDQEETLIHMLWTCPATQSFLNKIKTWFSAINVKCSFNERSFIFNTNIGTNMSKTELAIVIEIKYYIFSTKRLNGTLSTTAFKNRLKYTLLALKEIATQNGNLDSFKAQWNILYNILS